MVDEVLGRDIRHALLAEDWENRMRDGDQRFLQRNEEAIASESASEHEALDEGTQVEYLNDFLIWEISR